MDLKAYFLMLLSDACRAISTISRLWMSWLMSEPELGILGFRTLSEVTDSVCYTLLKDFIPELGLLKRDLTQHIKEQGRGTAPLGSPRHVQRFPQPLEPGDIVESKFAAKVHKHFSESKFPSESSQVKVAKRKFPS